MNSRLSSGDGSAPSATKAAELTTTACAHVPRRNPRVQMNTALRRLEQLPQFLRDLAAQGEKSRRDVEKVVEEVRAILADLRPDDNIGGSRSAHRRHLRAWSREGEVLTSAWLVLRECLHDLRLQHRHDAKMEQQLQRLNAWRDGTLNAEEGEALEAELKEVPEYPQYGEWPAAYRLGPQPQPQQR